MKHQLLLLIISIFALLSGCQQEARRIKVATYNCSFNRDMAGKLIKDLSSPDHTQAKNVAEIIQRVRPEILILNEFDYDAAGKGMALFQQNYLAIPQHDQSPIEYAYSLAIPSNTGILSTADMNGDGKIELPNDAYGYGKQSGQYAFVVLSQFPIDREKMRTFQHFLWKDMPNAHKPFHPETGASYFSDEAWEQFRLSSKNHLDLPVDVEGKEIHLLVSHPTPPSFDGPEDHNGKRNYDEIRLFADYITGGEKAAYLVDDKGQKGGLPPNAFFILFGDQNADPKDGASFDNAILQLLDHPKINPKVAKGNLVPASEGGEENSNRNEKLKNQKSNPRFDTAHWGLRADYVLPSADLKAVASGIFWPTEADPLRYLLEKGKSSDHLLVWVEIEI